MLKKMDEKMDEKLIKSYLQENKIIDENLINFIIKSSIEDLDLCKYIKSFSVGQVEQIYSVTPEGFKREKVNGKFNPYSKKLEILMSSVPYHNVMELNINILCKTFLELSRVIQLKQIDEKSTAINYPEYFLQIFNNYCFFNDNHDYYNDNKNKMLTEYNALIVSMLKILNILNKTKKINKDILYQYNQQLASFIAENYEYTNPIETSNLLINTYYDNFNQNILKSIEKTNDQMLLSRYKHALQNKDKQPTSTIERLIYGYELNPNTLNIIDKVAEGKIKTHDLTRKIGTR